MHDASRFKVCVNEGVDLRGAVIAKRIEVIARYNPEAFWWESLLPAYGLASRYDTFVNKARRLTVLPDTMKTPSPV